MRGFVSELMRELLSIVLRIVGVVIAAPRIMRNIVFEHKASVDGPRSEHRRARSGGAGLKHPLWEPVLYFTVFGLLMAAGGLIVAVSGIIPIRASSRHWAITQWLLDFSSQRSVATHVLGMEVPPLDRPGLVVKGAGSYETNCRFCHGSPSFPNPRVAQRMTPLPPYLPDVLSEWEDAELFYIVKHGIKFTGMPAWPAQQRDDEVWAMVAFLRALPGLDGNAYRRLVSGVEVPAGGAVPAVDLADPQSVPLAITGSCARCHGMDGLGRGGAFPKLAGQSSGYMFLSLQAYARGDRHSGIMEPIAAGLDSEVMAETALYYSQMPTPPASSSLSEETSLAIQRGEAIASRGIPAQRVPSCASCHGPGAAPRNRNYPSHAGQNADYLVLQLELFKRRERGGTAYAHLMNPAADHLTPEQMRDVALYYGSLDFR